ncbi:MAG: DUF6265 family protein [Chitinophagaceae bacterium]
MSKMKRMLPVVPVMMVMVCLLSATNAVYKGEIAKASWLLGNWQNNTPRGLLTESWQQKNDSTYTGKSSFVRGKDTLSSETLTLQERGGSLYYVPVVKDQNNGQPVTFKLTSSSATQLVFENPAHDFPQKITYTLVTKDSLLAVISGMRNGQERAVQFPMGRVK